MNKTSQTITREDLFSAGNTIGTQGKRTVEVGVEITVRAQNRGCPFAACTLAVPIAIDLEQTNQSVVNISGSEKQRTEVANSLPSELLAKSNSGDLLSSHNRSADLPVSPEQTVCEQKTTPELTYVLRWQQLFSSMQ